MSSLRLFGMFPCFQVDKRIDLATTSTGCKKDSIKNSTTLLSLRSPHLIIDGTIDIHECESINSRYWSYNQSSRSIEIVNPARKRFFGGWSHWKFQIMQKNSYSPIIKAFGSSITELIIIVLPTEGLKMTIGNRQSLLMSFTKCSDNLLENV